MRISDWSSDVCSSDLFAVPQPLALERMVEPYGAEGRVVRDEKEHRLLQPVHFISAGTRKPLPILMECLRVFDLARESRALARGSLFQLAGFSLARRDRKSTRLNSSH